METHTSLSPATHSSSSDGIYNPSSVFWVFPGVSSQLNEPEKHPKGGNLEAS